MTDTTANDGAAALGSRRLASDMTGKSAVDLAPRFATRNALFAAVVVIAATGALTLLALAVDVIYHRLVHGNAHAFELHAAIGVMVALGYVVPFVARGDVTVEAYLSGGHGARRTFVAWNMAFLFALTVLFLTKTSADFSRGSLLTFFAVGGVAMLGFERLVRAIVLGGLASGRLAARRIMMVGTRDELAAFQTRLEKRASYAERQSMRVIAVAVVPDDLFQQSALDDALEASQLLEQTLASAAKTARGLLPDDVVILGPWALGPHLDRCIEPFMSMPTSIHIDGGEVLGRFSDVQVRRLGGAPTVSLTEPPLRPLDVVAKRVFDIVGASIGLVLLAPVFLAVAWAIRRESKGQAFFRQDRLGFNQRKFRIFKFRSMITQDNGPVIKQATANDPRITRVGAFIRKTNIDELPQLINVLKGEMSLVGPRPHAIAHDLDYAKRIIRYPRRLNVKPGITGWAQVNGFRGETKTDAEMRDRVTYDLHYVDNWSLLFDVYIIFLTVFSPRAYRNAK